MVPYCFQRIFFNGNGARFASSDLARPFSVPDDPGKRLSYPWEKGSPSQMRGGPIKG
jgi:hypothetical protein